MPPKAKITEEMIIDAGFEIARECGAENINARTISSKLGCSTQPVMYHFKRIEDIKKAVYQKVDKYHTAYITDFHGKEPMKEIGLSYIRFAAEEKHFFRFLFQSNEFSEKHITDLVNAEEAAPLLAIFGDGADISKKQAKEIFRILFLFAHGYASIFANNSLEFDEDMILADLESVFAGAVSQEGMQ